MHLDECEVRLYVLGQEVIVLCKTGEGRQRVAKGHPLKEVINLPVCSKWSVFSRSGNNGKMYLFGPVTLKITTYFFRLT